MESSFYPSFSIIGVIFMVKTFSYVIYLYQAIFKLIKNKDYFHISLTIFFLEGNWLWIWSEENEGTKEV